jgi:putative ABC transport system permease protein
MSELDDELQFHLEEQTRLNIAKGMSSSEARREACASLGSIAAIHDNVRDVRRFTWIEDLFADWRHGIRNLRGKPALVSTAVLSLALGVAVNSTAFSIAMATVFSSPSVRDPATLFEFAFQNSSHVSEPNLRDLALANLSGGIAGYAVREYVLTTGDRNLRVFGQIVTSGYFDVTGTAVAQGRGLAASDEFATVVSYRFAQMQSLTLGSEIVLSRETFRIVGILPSDFRSTLGMGLVPDVIVPVNDHVFHGVHNRSFRDFTAIARAKAGQSSGQLRRALNAASAALVGQFPADNQGMGEVRVLRSYSPWTRSATRGFGAEQAFLGVLILLATAVLLIACANVAGVLLAHGIDRRHEMVLRQAIGASRSRIVRQLLAETTLIAVLGLAAGLLLNRWLTGMAQGLGNLAGMPAEFRLWAPQFSIDGAMASYLVTVLAATTLVCGLLPALQTSKHGLASSLKGLKPRPGRLGMRKSLAVVQVALSFSLLVLSILFFRSSESVRGSNPGFDVDHTLIARPTTQSDAEVNALYMRKAEEAVRRLPGVVELSWAALAPLAGEHYSNALHPIESPDIAWPHHSNTVSPRYFATMEIPLLAGREFLESDAAGAPTVVIVNQAFSERYFPGKIALGRQMREDGRLVQIVGIVRNSKYNSLGERPGPLLYRCLLQPPDIRRVSSLHVRFDRPAAQFVQALQHTIEATNQSFAVRVYSTRDQVTAAELPYRAGAAVLIALGALGMLLAFGGLYGLIAYTVAQRTHEMGIRLALGATRHQVLSMITQDALRIVAAGSAVGVLVVAACGGGLKDFLAADVEPLDPRHYAPVLALAFFTGVVASLWPALRAIRRNPVASLRHDSIQ